MKLLPILLINVATVGAGIVIYDQLKDDQMTAVYDDIGDSGLESRIAALEERSGKVGIPVEHLVVDGGGRNQERVATLEAVPKAQQSDHVRRVGVERLSLRRLVDANGRVGGGGAGVPDMAEQVAGCVLAAGPAEVGADGHERRRGVRVGELGDR